MSFVPHRQHPDGSAILQCDIWVDNTRGEVRCEYDAKPGTTRCGLHRTLPADMWRCHHVLTNGQRCPAGIPTARRGKDHYCNQRHMPACPGHDGNPCGKRMTRADTPLCWVCAAKARNAAKPTCWVPGKTLDDRCGKDVTTDAGTCGNHRPERWPGDDQRCVYRYAPPVEGDDIDRTRCIRKRTNGTACAIHGQPCRNCGTKTPEGDAGVAVCRKCRMRCAKDGCRDIATVGVWCTDHDPDRTVCVATTNAGTPCDKTAEGGSDRCGVHQAVAAKPAAQPPPPPTDEPRGPDGRLATSACTGCGAVTTAESGRCRACRTQDDRCRGMVLNGPNAGTRCRRMATIGGLCRAHDRNRATGTPCEATFRDGDEELPCIEAPVPGDARCKAHGGTPRCSEWVGKGDGRPCNGSPMPNGLCSRHQGVLAMADKDRCAHVYPNGKRCSQLNRGSHGNGFDVVCDQHRVPCIVAGCEKTTADLVGRTCQRHREGCVATVADGRYSTVGRPCGKTRAVGSAWCEVHIAQAKLADADRCAHEFSNGDRCLAARHRATYAGVTRSFHRVCQAHWQVCREPGCTTLTGLPGFICETHRDRCSHAKGCNLAEVIDGLCERHWMVKVAGTCALRNVFGEPCEHPATVPTAEGLICKKHASILPADEDRCRHVHDSGERCAAQRLDQRGWVWCSRHSSAHGEACPEISVLTGAPCARNRMHLPDGSHAATCDRHVLPPDEERCRGEVIPGRRCPARIATPFDWACAWHRSQAPRCTATPYDIPCTRPAVRDHDRCPRHPDWDPEWPYETKVDFERWFLMPNLDLFWDLVALETGIEPPDVSRPSYGSLITSVSTEGVAMWGAAEQALGPEPIVENDPYDLTGARRAALELIAEGMDPVEARQAASLMAHNWSPSTVSSLTSSLKGYLAFCEERGYQAVPASAATLFAYFNHLKNLGVRGADGQKIRDYAPSSVDQFRSAIRQVHEARGLPDPFTQDRRLAHLINGLKKVVARPQVQAHAIRLNELGQLVEATYEDTLANLRNQALVALYTHPDAPSGRVIADLTWGQVSLPAEDGATLRISFPFRSGVKTVEIEPLPDEQVVVDDERLNLRLACPAHLLSAYQFERELVDGHHLRGDDRVFLTESGKPFSGEPGVRKVATTACKAAGVTYASTLDVENRLRLALYLAEPPILALRDAAVMTTMWWASLRRSEVGNLTVGDVAADGRGRGIWLLVRKDKVQQDGRYVPIPHTGVGGRPTLVQDGVKVLHRWLDAYRRILNGGEPLTDDLPLFPAIGNTAYGEDAAHTLEGADGISGGTVGLILGRYLDRTSIRAELGETLTMHGFRAGFATEWLAKGGDAVPLAKRQRRKSVESLLGYYRLRDAFEDSLTHILDLDGVHVDFDAMVDRAHDI